ncbi:MAG: substrate-binding domain-containing protein [Anaerolineae bacterium]|nr:substrate-binding domain-containing protein [Anaerolineae bacterium]
MKRIVLAAIVLLLLMGGCKGTPAQPEGDGTNGTITASGAFALYPMMIRWSEEFNKQYPDVQFDISAGGAGKGMTDALAGAVDMGMVSRGVQQVEIDKGAFWVAVTMDAVLPTINAQNPYLTRIQAQGVTSATFAAIWTGEITTWGQVLNDPNISDAIHLYTRSDACGAAETWGKYLGDLKQEDLQGIAVDGDPGLAAAVAGDVLGIGYNNLNFAYDADSKMPVAGVQIVPVDINANGQLEGDENFYTTKDDVIAAITDGRYPRPPARPLNLVTLNKPVGLTKTFIEWVLTDGQAFVDEAGYVPLTQEQLQEQMEKLR